MKRFSIILFAVFFIFAASTVAFASDKVYKLVGATNTPGNFAQWDIPGKEFAKRVHERTNGRVEIRLVFGGALLDTKTMLDGLSKGVADLGALLTGMDPGRLPVEGQLSNITDLKLGTKLGPRGTVFVHKKLIEEFPAFAGEYERLGIKVLFLTPVDPYGFMTKFPINKLEDCKGKKIRTFGKYLPMLIEATGAVPVSLEAGEVYSALTRGVIDGLCTTIDGGVSFKWCEVAPYLTKVGKRGTIPALITGQWAINMNSWNKLPPDLQKIILEVSDEMEEWCVDYIEKVSDEASKKCAGMGKGKIDYLPEQEVDKWYEATPPFFDIAAKELNDKGLPGTEIVKRYRELAHDYLQGRRP